MSLEQVVGEGDGICEAVHERGWWTEQKHHELPKHGGLRLRTSSGRGARQVDDVEQGGWVHRQVDLLVHHEAWSAEPHALHEDLNGGQELGNQVGAASSVLQLNHEVILEHLQTIGDLRPLAHDKVGGQWGVLLEVWRGQELLDHPVTHLLVVPGDGDESWLNETALDADKRCKEVKLALDLVYSLPLIGYDSQHRREVARADLGEHLECGLLLLARDEVLGPLGQHSRRLGQLVAEERDVVDGEGRALGLSGGEWAVLKATENMPSHAELDVVRLEVLERSKLAVDQGLDGLSGFSWMDFEAVQVLAEDSGLDLAEAVVLDEFEAAYCSEIAAIEASLHQHREWLSVGLGVSLPVVREAHLNLLHQ